jgi:outer membrane protein assembly factor BamE (lipoprotein component of BamABCDE complex)
MSVSPANSTIVRLLAAAFCVAGTAACDPVTDVRGHVPTPGSMEKIEVASQSRQDVIRLLGSPSTVSTFNDKTWYYIRQKQTQFAFMGIDTVEQSVTAITFNDEGRIASVKSYELKDGKEVDMVDRKTPTSGKELTVLDQLLGNVGRFSTPKQSVPGTVGRGPGGGL